MAILEAAGPLTTRQLAEKLGANGSWVYRICKQMERDGRLASKLVKGSSRVFFFPATREVVHHGSYARIQAVDKRLRTVVGQFSLPGQREQMVVALESAFQELIESTSQNAALEEFQEELLAAVLEAKKRGDVTSHLGLRPMHPNTRRWEIGRQLSLVV